MKIGMKVIILFAVTFSAFQALAENRGVLSNASQAQEVSWLGFKKYADIEVPEWIQQSHQSIFEVVIPIGEMTVVKSDDESAAWNEWIAFQLHNCQNQQIRLCPIYVQMGNGTAWLVHDSHTLATAAHVVHDWIKSVFELNPNLSMPKIRLPVRVLSNSTEIISYADFSLGQNRASAAFWRRDMEDTDNDFNSEYVELNLNKSIQGTPLSVASGYELKDTDIVYSVGYPNRTGVFKHLGAMDAPGRTLVASSGKLITAKGLRQNPKDARLSFSNACFSGNSGGPIFNKAGKVVGMTIAGDIKMHHGKLVSVCLALNLMNKKGLEAGL